MTRGLLILILLGFMRDAEAQQHCAVVARIAPMPELPEASGVALSRRTPGLLWAHNDSSEPMLFAIDASGSVRGRVTIAGAEAVDWEDISAGPCPQGSCLYIADIGDNNRVRRRIRIYRVPEPRPDETTTRPAEVFEATYPDGAQDAEALFISGAGDPFIVTKAESGKTAVYRWPTPLRSGNPVALQLVRRLPLARITDADVSPDGARVALRTNDEILFYPTADLLKAKASTPQRFDVRSLREPQGEGVTLGTDGTVYLVGEGTAGTIATVRCPGAGARAR